MPFELGNKLAVGRPAGVPNKLNQEIRDMVRQALEASGGVSYLVQQASENPVAFMSLIAKIIPSDVNIKIKEMPEARVYPQGLPITIEHNEQAGLPATSEAVDCVH